MMGDVKATVVAWTRDRDEDVVNLWCAMVQVNEGIDCGRQRSVDLMLHEESMVLLYWLTVLLTTRYGGEGI